MGQQSVVDLSSEEEPCATAALRIAVNAHGRVMGISKAGSGGIHPTLTQVRAAALARIPVVVASKSGPTIMLCRRTVCGSFAVCFCGVLYC